MVHFLPATSFTACVSCNGSRKQGKGLVLVMLVFNTADNPGNRDCS